MNNIPCFLIPFLVGSICGFLGYLLGRMFNDGSSNSNELSLQAQLDACLANSIRMTSKIESKEETLSSVLPKTENFVDPVADLAKPEAKVVVKSDYDAKAVAVIMGKKWKQDDLKIVEGIGPKIEELYHAAGITTWDSLAETTVKQSQAILDGGGDKFKMHNPKTWAKQAKMAAEGKWKALKKWQDEHKGGKE